MTTSHHIGRHAGREVFIAIGFRQVEKALFEEGR